MTAAKKARMMIEVLRTILVVAVAFIVGALLSDVIRAM